MLAQLRIELDSDEKIGFLQSSLFQGVLMEKISPEYSAFLHESKLHPYSQYLIFDSKLCWIVTTTNKDAYKNIIEPLLSADFTSVYLEKKDITIRIISKAVSVVEQKELVEEFYRGKAEKYLSVEFISPTAFKSNNQYIFMPGIKLIFGSLMKKYSASSIDMNMCDEDALEYIVNNVSISSFNIKSVLFHLEGVKIPAFKGRVTFRFSGTDTMASYARLLLRFGEYSGVGIKTGIGMGAIKILKKGDTDHE